MNHQKCFMQNIIHILIHKATEMGCVRCRYLSHYCTEHSSIMGYPFSLKTPILVVFLEWQV